MNATPNYNLNQWDASDRVLRTDFNADNAKIDAAVKGVDSRVDSLNSSVGAINTALGTKATTTALNSAVSRISSLESGKVDKSAHSSDVSALRSENCWVKLGAAYTTAEGQTASVTIANISGYRELEIVFRGCGTNKYVGDLRLAVNGVEDPACIGSEGDFTSTSKYLLLARFATRATPGQGYGGGTARLFPLWPDELVALSSSYISRSETNRDFANTLWHGRQVLTVSPANSWSGIRSLVMSGEQPLLAGSGFTVYGLKK